MVRALLLGIGKRGGGDERELAERRKSTIQNTS